MNFKNLNKIDVNSPEVMAQLIESKGKLFISNFNEIKLYDNDLTDMLSFSKNLGVKIEEAFMIITRNTQSKTYKTKDEYYIVVNNNNETNLISLSKKDYLIYLKNATDIIIKGLIYKELKEDFTPEILDLSFINNYKNLKKSEMQINSENVQY